MIQTEFRHPHPGEILKAMAQQLGTTPSRMALRMGVQPARLCAIARGEREVSVDTALRLERYLGVPAIRWLRAQNLYDLERAERERGEIIREEVQQRGHAEITSSLIDRILPACGDADMRATGAVIARFAVHQDVPSTSVSG